MSVRIILDSSADVAEKIKKNFKFVPLPVFFGETRYEDGVNLSHAEFYKMLAESSVLPTTSQATPFDYSKVYKETVGAGDEAVVLTLSKKLSGTYQSASVAARDYPGKIFVVDSETVTIGTGVLAAYALKLIGEGLSAKETAEEIEAKKGRVRIVARVETLEYLKRGGRISRTVAFAGELLSFKPVIAVEGGEVILLGKARGAKQSNNLLEQEIAKSGGVDFSMPVLLGYTGTDDSVLKSYISDFSHLWTGHADSLDIAEIGCLVGTHVGPGAIGAAYFAADR